MSGKSTRTDWWKGSWKAQILPRRVFEEYQMLEQIFTTDDVLFPGNRRLAFTHKQAKSVPDFKVLLDKIMTYLRTVWPATSWNPSVIWNRETPGLSSRSISMHSRGLSWAMRRQGAPSFRLKESSCCRQDGKRCLVPTVPLKFHLPVMLWHLFSLWT